MHKVIVVDDHRSFRESLAIAVPQVAPFAFVGLAGSARQAYPLIEAEKPDLLIVDISLEDSDGIALAWELRRRRVSVPILILTMHTNGMLVREALDAGARGYATKGQTLEEIVQAMRDCVAGERYISPLVSGVPDATKGPHEEGRDLGLLGRLSRREREIFSQIIRGQSTEQIGRALYISLKTVETHRSHINRKLGVHSPAELMRLAALKGLLPNATWAAASAESANGQGREYSQADLVGDQQASSP